MVTESAADRPGRARLALILGSLSAFGPMSIDLYLPALPQLTGDFGISEVAAQLTLTACLAGLALGQLLAGPCSDALGRRWPLLAGLLCYAVASAGCALAPNAGVLTGLRLVQGLAGAAGLVIARAAARDLFSGVQLARFLSLLALVMGLAPVLAPSLGGQLMRVLPWQGLFWLLACWGLLLLVSVALGLPETLPRHARRGGGLRAVARVMGELLAQHRFVGCALSAGLTFAAMFCYISGSPFVLQQLYRLSPQSFALAFGVNALGIALLSQLNRVLLRRFATSALLVSGLCVGVLGGLWLLVSTPLHLGLPALLVGLFLVVSSVGLVMPNATALALAGRPEQAGSASALLGVMQFSFGALAAPLVGATGSGSALPMAALMCGLTLAGLLAYLVLARPRVPAAPDTRPVGQADL